MKIDFEDKDIDTIAQRVAALLLPVLSRQKASGNDDDVFDVNGLAEYLKVDPSWIYKSLDRLPHLKMGKYLRFKKSAVDKYLDRETIRPTSDLRVVTR